MKRMLLGISIGFFYTLLSICISLFTTPYYLKFLSREEFGVFYILNNLIVWTGLLNVGLRGSFKMQFAAAIGRGENVAKMATTFTFTQCVIAATVAFIGFVSSFFLPALLSISVASMPQIHVVVILLSLSFAITLLSNALASILTVHNKDFDVYKGRCIVLLFQTALSVLLLYTNLGLLGLAYSALAAELIFLSYIFYTVNIKQHFVKIKFSLFDRQLLVELLSTGKWFLAGFFAQLLIRHTDLFLIKKLTAIDQVTPFIISSKLYFIASGFLLIIIKVITPQLIKLHQGEAHTGFFSSQIKIFAKSFTLVSLLAGGVIFIGNEWFVSWWIGESYYLGNGINFLLMLAFLFSSLNMAIRTVFMAKLQLKEQKISALIEGGFHLVLTVVLGIYLGLYGIITGMAFSSMLACIVSLSMIYKQFTTTQKEKRTTLPAH